jgi:hypothetical protein
MEVRRWIGLTINKFGSPFFASPASVAPKESSSIAEAASSFAGAATEDRMAGQDGVLASQGSAKTSLDYGKIANAITGRP